MVSGREPGPGRGGGSARRFARRIASLVAFGLAVAAKDGRAVDRFEIQVYDGKTNDPGVVSLEQHVNFTDRGRRKQSGPESPTEHQLHWTFEGALGATRVWEPGVYFQTALLPDGTLAYAGMKLRSKLMADPLFDGRLRLGVNFEIGSVPERFESDRWSVEARPIAALTLPWLLASINPILGVPLAGVGYRDGPHLEPAASVKGRLSEAAALGIEYYGAFGPLVAPDAPGEQEHYVYGAGDYSLGHGLDLNVGVGYGSGAADELTFKAILGWEIGRVFGP